jgi:DNA polymerase V
MTINERGTGFPSPAQGYEEKNLDFNHLLVKNPAATFTMQLHSAEMAHRGIMQESLLIVDRSVTPVSGSLVVISCAGTFLCREMYKKADSVVFSNGITDIPHNEDIELFGTVTAVVKLL